MRKTKAYKIVLKDLKQKRDGVMKEGSKICNEEAYLIRRAIYYLSSIPGSKS